MTRTLALIGCFAAACGSATSGTPYYPPTNNDMPAPPTVNYCGAKGKKYIHLSDCTARCVPDEQVFFLCTELRGKIAYTRQFLTVPQSFGYSLEYSDGSKRCGDVAASVWSLVPLQGLTNANVGRMTASSVGNDCSTLPMLAPYIEANLDRLYYVPVGPVASGVL